MPIRVAGIERGENKSVVTLAVSLGRVPGSTDTLSFGAEGMEFPITVRHPANMKLSDAELSEAAQTALGLVAREILKQVASSGEIG